LTLSLSTKDFISDGVFHDYDIILNNNIIGRYTVTIGKNEIYFGFFEILEKYRGYGYGKNAIKLIKENLKKLSLEYSLEELEVCVKPLETSTFSLEDLAAFYKKYLEVEKDYEGNNFWIMRGTININ